MSGEFDATGAWRRMAQLYWNALRAAHKEQGHENPHQFWSYTCQHGLSCSFSWECPACAAAKISRLEQKNRVLKRALKLARCCRVRAQKSS